MADITINRNAQARTSLGEAKIRIGNAHAALYGLHVLLKQCDDLSELQGLHLAALIWSPLDEIGMAGDEVHSVGRQLWERDDDESDDPGRA